MLDAALHVFIEKGFDGATMLEIATRAQVGKGTLYGLAPSKEELFLRTVFDALEQMLRGLSPAFHRIEDPRASLRQIVGGLMESTEQRTSITWLSIELLARASRDQRLRERVMAAFRALYAQFLGPVQTLIETAQAQGRVVDGNPEILARLLAALLDGLGFQAIFEGARLRRHEALDTVFRLIEREPASAAPVESSEGMAHPLPAADRQGAPHE